jgi:tetratricopeptide (TPR) repeat protein
VRRSGNRLRVVAQLVNVADGYHLWSERYDRTMDDVFAIQDEIAQSIAHALQVVLTEQDKKALVKVPTHNVQAYDCYLRGRQYLHQYRRKSIEFALQMFARAIQIDPSFARAHAGQADGYGLLYMTWDRNAAILQKADGASRKALELDQDLAEAHVSRGLALSLAKRYDEARGEFDTAIRQNPHLFEAYFYYGRVCQKQGQFIEAERLFQQAAQVHPDDYQALLMQADVCQALGRCADAQATSRLGLERAERYAGLHPDDARPLALGAGHWCLLGDTERALDWVERAMALDPQEPLTLYNVACVYALSGRRDDAVDCLEKAVAHGYSDREWMRKDADLAVLHGHPRFEALLSR